MVEGYDVGHIEDLTWDTAAKEFKDRIEGSLPEERIRFLTNILSLVKTDEEVNAGLAVERLKAYIKSNLIMESIRSQVELYGEPVLTVEKTLEMVESDRRYTNPVESADLELIKGFIRGYLIKVNPSKDVKLDRCLEMMISRLYDRKEEPKKIHEDVYVSSDFEEIKLPEKFKKYYKVVDLLMKYLVTCLLEVCKEEPSDDIEGLPPSHQPADVECEQVASTWLRHEIQSRLGLMSILSHTMCVQHRSGQVVAEPVLFFRDNVIERKKKTICFFGFISDFSSPKLKLKFDKTYTPKRLYSRHVHDIKGPLIAYLTALKLLKSVLNKFPFNVKLILLPYRIKNEARLKHILEEKLDFLDKVDYFVLMNGIDYMSPTACIINSAVGEKIYSLAVYLPQDHPAFKENFNECWERLRIIIFEMMDLIRQWKCFVKCKKTFEKADVTGEEYYYRVDFGCAERVERMAEYRKRLIPMVGWEAQVSMMTYTSMKHLTALITNEDFNEIKEMLKSPDPILEDCHFELYLKDSCRQWTGGDTYYDQLAPILKLALLRGSDGHRFHVGRSNSALSIPVLLKKMLKKETVAVSFGGIEEFDHHAVSFTQLKEAVKIAVSLILGLKLDGRRISQSEKDLRSVDVLSVTGVAEIPISIHLESPFCRNDPEIGRIYKQFLLELQPKKERSVSKISLAPPLESDVGEAGMVAKYFSADQNSWIVLKYSYLDKIQEQRKYYDEMGSIIRKKGVWKEREMAHRMVTFLLYLFFKKRRSDVICKNCKVYECRMPGSPFLSALAKGSEPKEGSSLVADCADPFWVPLQAGEDSDYQLVDSKGFISYTGFMQLAKDLIFNIVFDGNENGPVEKLFKMIISEKRTKQNNRLIKAIANNFYKKHNKNLCEIAIMTNDFPKYSLYFSIIPKILYNLEKIYQSKFVEDLVCSEEIKHYVLLDSIQKYLTKKRFELRITESSSTFVSVQSAPDNQAHIEETIELDENIYRMIDRTLIEKLLQNELVILPPPLPCGGVSQEEQIPYPRSAKWYLAYAYLKNKSRKGVEMYNDMWALYKQKLHKLTPGTSLYNVFPSEFRPSEETFDQETIYVIKNYVKYSITILEHFVRLNFNLKDIFLLYSVKPKFLNFEAYFILRDSFPEPRPLPRTPSVIALESQENEEEVEKENDDGVSDRGNNYEEVLSNSGTLEGSIQEDGFTMLDSGHNRKLSSVEANQSRMESSEYISAQTSSYIRTTNTNQTRHGPVQRDTSTRKGAPESRNSWNYPSTSASSSKRRIQENGKLQKSSSLRYNSSARRIADVKKESSRFTHRSSRSAAHSIATSKEIERKIYAKTVGKLKSVLDCLAENKEVWKDNASNNLLDFEEILMRNIEYWNSYHNGSDVENYKLCLKIYEKNEKVIINIINSDNKHMETSFPQNQKDYKLKEKLDSLLKYFGRLSNKNRTLYTYLDIQTSEFCKRPRDYYKKITECYTAICNLSKAIVTLQDRFPQIVPYEWIEIIRSKFPFLHDATSL